MECWNYGFRASIICWHSATRMSRERRAFLECCHAVVELVDCYSARLPVAAGLCTGAPDDSTGAAVGILASCENKRRHAGVSIRCSDRQTRRACSLRLVISRDSAGHVGETCAALAKANCSVDDIVTMTVYTTERRWGEIFTDMRKEVFKTGYPSSAFV